MWRRALSCVEVDGRAARLAEAMGYPLIAHVVGGCVLDASDDAVVALGIG